MVLHAVVEGAERFVVKSEELEEKFEAEKIRMKRGTEASLSPINGVK